MTDNLAGTASSAAETAGSAKSGARHRARQAKESVAAVVPGIGHDSVSALMRQADEAADRARDQEQHALALAIAAKESADEAARIAHESEQLVRGVRQETQDATVARVEEAKRTGAEVVAKIVRDREERVRQARAESEERVNRERQAGEAERRKRIEKAELKAAASSKAADRAAEQAQERARSAIKAANESTIRARELASEASKVARRAAVEASREADRLAAQAKDRAVEAEQRSDEASQVQQRTVRVRKSGPSRRPRRPAGSGRSGTTRPKQSRRDHLVGRDAHLDALTRNDLERLAGDLKIAGRESMRKPDLVTAVTKTGGLRLDQLTKSELVRLGRSHGAAVGMSMSKDELVAAISDSRATVGGGSASERKGRAK